MVNGTQGKDHQMDDEQDELRVSEKFGLLLKQYRKLRCMTYQELEQASGVSSGYNCRLENQERKSPSIVKILPLASALKIPDDVLVATLITDVIGEQKPAQSLTDVLIYSTYAVSNVALNGKAKELLVRINEFITMEMAWSNKSKMRELYELGELIDQLKEVI